MESLTPVANYILEGEFPKEFTTGQRRKLIKQASRFLWLERSLYQKGKDLVCRRVPSTNEIPKILKGLHEEACGGHFSHELTLKKVLLAGYVWPSMHADVQHWCRSCHNCQVNGNRRLLYGPRQAIIANGSFEKWGIDAMGPLPRTANGKVYILVAIDYMTRWVEAQSVAKVNEKTVSKFVYTHICCRFGTPIEIVSDNGPGFRRGLLTEVCEELKISHRHSTPYYPQSNGLVEKANWIIAGIIRKMVESKPKRWDNFLDGAIWAYRTTYRDATQFTLFHLDSDKEGSQKGAKAKGPSEHDRSNEEDTSTPLDWKSKKPRSEQQVAYAEAQARARVEARKKELADARATKVVTKLTKPMTMEEARLARIEKAKALQEVKRKIKAKQQAKEVDLTSQFRQGSTKKEVVDLMGHIEHLKEIQRDKNLEEQWATTLA
ncbi:hypothetical protein L7F22_035463 [Adiantum nelumboides]|nr:hypothetical protein [Adiantum nelumboides]